MKKQASIYKSEQGKASIHSQYEQYLETFQATFTRLEIDTRYGSTHLLTTGPEDGEPVFIFQGGNCINPVSLAWFQPLFNNYKIYAPDTPGHPGLSDETRLSAKDASFALWVEDLMKELKLEQASFIGPSYGAGIVLRLAAHKPERIKKSVLIVPAGLVLGSKLAMIRKILVPLIGYKLLKKEAYIHKITDIMSLGEMQPIDRKLIAAIFRYVKLEQAMPKLTAKEELVDYHAPTMVFSGKSDIFFPGAAVAEKAAQVIPNLAVNEVIEMAHFPNAAQIININRQIKAFLNIV